MRTFPALAACAASALLLAGCGTFQDNTGTDNTDGSSGQEAQPTVDPDDDFQPLAVNMVAHSGTHFPNGVDGVTFGCSDTLVSVSTVPIEAETPEEHTAAAIEFLLDDSQYYHGDPAVTNSLTLSETLELANVEVDGDEVNVGLTGDVVIRGECEAYRIQAQLYGTVASTAGTENVHITVNGTELDDVLGVDPFDTSQVFVRGAE